MASINDLKTNESYTGTGMANGGENGVLEIANPKIGRKRVNKAVATPATGTPIAPQKPKRKLADLSILPKEDNTQGLDIHTSIEDDVFHEGGPFDQYKERKAREMKEINDMIDEHNAMIAASRGEEVPSDEEIEAME